MHSKPMAESDGAFNNKGELSDRICIKCNQKGKVYIQIWESSCGGYEDVKFTCRNCGKVWWIEGSDS